MLVAVFSDPDVPVYIGGKNLLTDNARDGCFVERDISVVVARERVRGGLEQTHENEDGQDY